MKKKIITLFGLLTIFTIGLTAQTTINVKPDPTIQYQQIEGWGSSLCWWAHMVGKWTDEAKIDTIVKYITSPKYLNMNIFRYNIGGGDDPTHYSTDSTLGHMARGKGVRAEMHGFWPGPNEPYNWSADAAQRKIMLMIKEKRPDAIFEAFSNSPPYWMTYSGCSAGNDPASADNLKPEYYGMFCDYLINVCKFYKDSFNIRFNTLEPFNEPQTSYWGYLGGQEGCHFDVSSQIALIRVLYPKLKASGLNTVISAADETNVAACDKGLEQYIKAGDIIDKIGQINTHTYIGTLADKAKAHQLAKETGKRLWMSETGPSGYRGSAFSVNLQLAKKMFNDLKIMRASAWIDWQMIEEHNNTWGLLRGNFAKEKFVTIKNFYVRMQVTRFIKQGYTLIKSGNSDVLTALSPDKKQLVAVVLNQSGDSESFNFDLSAFNINNGNAQIFRTSTVENCQPLADANITGGTMKYELPNLSITTFIIPVM